MGPEPMMSTLWMSVRFMVDHSSLTQNELGIRKRV